MVEKHVLLCIYRRNSPLGDASQKPQNEKGLNTCKEGTEGEECDRGIEVPDPCSHSISPTAQQEAEEGTKPDPGGIIFLSCLEIKHQAPVGSEGSRPKIFPGNRSRTNAHFAGSAL